MAFRVDELANDLRELGIQPGGLLTIHSSYKHIGETVNGADGVLDAVRLALGETGTVILPSFTFYLLTKDDPIWSYDNSSSCVGILSEQFRKQHATHRSIHLSHSFAAAGPLAEELTDTDLTGTPCGIDSPLGKFLRRDGTILLAGVTLNCCTAVHVAEELCSVPYVSFATKPAARYERNGQLHALPSRIVRPFDYDFERLETPLREAGALTYGKLGHAETLVISGRKLLTTVEKILRRDPEFLHRGSPVC